MAFTYFGAGDGMPSVVRSFLYVREHGFFFIKLTNVWIIDAGVSWFLYLFGKDHYRLISNFLTCPGLDSKPERW